MKNSRHLNTFVFDSRDTHLDHPPTQFCDKKTILTIARPVPHAHKAFPMIE